MKMIRPTTLWIAALMGLLAISQLSAQALTPGQESDPPVISTRVSVSSVQVAEPFLLEIKCIAPAGTNVNFPAVMEKLGEFDVIDYQDTFDVPLGSDSNQRSWTRQMKLESIVTGALKIPAIEVQISGEAEPKRLASNSIDMQVLSVLEDRADPKNFRDVKPLVDVPMEAESSHAWIGWTVAGLAGSALSAWMLLAFTRRRRFITPVQWANREFNQLEQSYSSILAASANPGEVTGEVLESAQTEHLASQISSIIREFLEMQLDIAAPNQTTTELLKAVTARGAMDEVTTHRMSELFTLADQAKYGGRELSDAQLRAAIQESRSLVNQIADEAANATAADKDAA